MNLSAPVFQLKRRAKLIARDSGVPLHEALDRIAREEGFERWSLLSARSSVVPQADEMLPRLRNGEMLLIAGRPGHGKTMLGLRLLLEAAREARKSVLFTLELTEHQARASIRALANVNPGNSEAIEIVTSDEISGDFIVKHLTGQASGAVAVIDYLQLLDQQRSKPTLAEQVRVLGKFAKESGVVLGFISQIDRSFDPQKKRLPDVRDIRLPNHVDMNLFTKACFMHDGEIRLQQMT